MMGQQPADEAAPHYRAFISYNHADAGFARWLHRKLETIRLPDGTRLAPIFIDRAELVAGPDLSAQVRTALGQSAAMVVVASPSARTSRWVAQEVELFRALHPDRPILSALIAGEPAEAFPEALLRHAGREVEPLAADFREKQDGRRLGLLKIAAGLSGQPLDRLVQRDAQSRQRRVMAVTAGVFVLSLILAALLVIAIRARTEAERQRAEAEGLVEFMLTDLREKLIGVGRIDVMDAVTQRSMDYYRKQADLSALSPESLDRRARVIEAMGQDDELRGRIDAAYAKYQVHDRIASTLLEKDPNNPDRIFAKAQSENRLALIETTRGNHADGYKRFGQAGALLARLPAQGRKAEWAALDSLVAGNLCATGARVAEAPQTIIEHCRRAVALTEQRVSTGPGRDQARYELAFHYFWLGSALNAAGDRAQARAFFARCLAMVDGLIAADPRNMRWREQHMELSFSLARIAGAQGERAEAARLIAMASADAARLAAHDPENQYWKDFAIRIAQFEQGRMQ